MSGVQTIGGITLTAGGIQPGGDVETLLLAICADRSNALNSVAQGQAAEMQQSNQKIAQLNDLLNKLRAQAPTTDDGKGKVSTQLSTADQQTLASFGVNYSDYVKSDGSVPTSGGFGNLMEAVKTQIDTVSSSSQLDMIKLQSTINKANQAVDMMTNLVQKFSDVKDKIIGNIR